MYFAASNLLKIGTAPTIGPCLETEMSRRRTGRSGFSIIELLVIIAIIAILAGLIVPAVLSGIESARRIGCQNNFRQIGIALHEYVDAKGCFPPAFWNGPTTDVVTLPPGWGWGAMLLPFLGEESLYLNAGVPNLLFGAGANPAQANAFTQTVLAFYRCPSDSGPALNSVGLNHATSNYVAVAGPGDIVGDAAEGSAALVVSASQGDWGGVMFPNSRVKVADITDGLSATIAVGEVMYYDQGGCYASIWAGMTGFVINQGETGVSVWVVGGIRDSNGNWTQMINDGGAAFSSWHPGGANFGFCDGSVRFFLQGINPETLARLCWRNDGVPVTIPD
jgi:prepilin-type processing-associated H-X9-DG protein